MSGEIIQAPQSKELTRAPAVETRPPLKPVEAGIKTLIGEPGTKRDDPRKLIDIIAQSNDVTPGGQETEDPKAKLDRAIGAIEKYNKTTPDDFRNLAKMLDTADQDQQVRILDIVGGKKGSELSLTHPDKVPRGVKLDDPGNDAAEPYRGFKVLLETGYEYKQDDLNKALADRLSEVAFERQEELAKRARAEAKAKASAEQSAVAAATKTEATAPAATVVEDIITEGNDAAPKVNKLVKLPARPATDAASAGAGSETKAPAAASAVETAAKTPPPAVEVKQPSASAEVGGQGKGSESSSDRIAGSGEQDAKSAARSEADHNALMAQLEAASKERMAKKAAKAAEKEAASPPAAETPGTQTPEAATAAESQIPAAESPQPQQNAEIPADSVVDAVHVTPEPLEPVKVDSRDSDFGHVDSADKGDNKPTVASEDLRILAGGLSGREGEDADGLNKRVGELVDRIKNGTSTDEDNMFITNALIAEARLHDQKLTIDQLGPLSHQLVDRIKNPGKNEEPETSGSEDGARKTIKTEDIGDSGAGGEIQDKKVTDGEMAQDNSGNSRPDNVVDFKPKWTDELVAEYKEHRPEEPSDRDQSAVVDDSDDKAKVNEAKDENAEHIVHTDRPDAKTDEELADIRAKKQEARDSAQQAGQQPEGDNDAMVIDLAQVQNINATSEPVKAQPDMQQQAPEALGEPTLEEKYNDVLSLPRDTKWTAEQMSRYSEYQSKKKLENQQKNKDQKDIAYQEYKRQRGEAYARGGPAAAQAYMREVAVSDPDGVGRTAKRILDEQEAKSNAQTETPKPQTQSEAGAVSPASPGETPPVEPAAPVSPDKVREINNSIKTGGAGGRETSPADSQQQPAAEAQTQTPISGENPIDAAAPQAKQRETPAEPTPSEQDTPPTAAQTESAAPPTPPESPPVIKNEDLLVAMSGAGGEVSAAQQTTPEPASAASTEAENANAELLQKMTEVAGENAVIDIEDQTQQKAIEDINTKLTESGVPADKQDEIDKSLNENPQAAPDVAAELKSINTADKSETDAKIHALEEEIKQLKQKLEQGQQLTPDEQDKLTKGTLLLAIILAIVAGALEGFKEGLEQSAKL